MKYKDIEKEIKIRNWMDLYEILSEYKIFKFYFIQFIINKIFPFVFHKFCGKKFLNMCIFK